MINVHNHQAARLRGLKYPFRNTCGAISRSTTFCAWNEYITSESISLPQSGQSTGFLSNDRFTVFRLLKGMVEYCGGHAAEKMGVSAGFALSNEFAQSNRETGGLALSIKIAARCNSALSNKARGAAAAHKNGALSRRCAQSIALS